MSKLMLLNKFHITFSTGLLISSLVFYYFDFLLFFINTNLFVYISLIYFSISIFNIAINSPHKEKLALYSGRTFITSLALLSIINIHSFYQRPLSSEIHLLLIYIATISGFITFYINKNQKEKILVVKKGSLYITIILILSSILYVYGIGSYSFQMDEFYHAAVSKTYTETGEFFKIDENSYTRSPLTSVIAIFSETLFNKFNNLVSIEFALRIPFVIFGLLSVYTAYLIGKRVTTETNALLISLFIACETYLMYFFTYLRFYSISIFVILFSIYLYIKIKNKLLISFVLSITSYIFYILLSEYFLFISLFFLFLFIGNYIKNNKKSALPMIFIATTAISIILYTLINRASVNEFYNPFAWTLNLNLAKIMLHWLYINYAAIIIVFACSFISRIKNIDLNDIVELFSIANLIFIFVYVVNVPFNFTFRTILFVLPILFIYFIKYLDSFYIRTLLGRLLVIFLISINLFMSIIYHADSAGRQYHPTKLLYEKIEIITDTKSIANYIKEYSQTHPIDSIIYIGLGDDLLKYYLGSNIPTISFKYSRLYDSILKDLTNYIEDNHGKNILVVVSANAIPNRKNELYERIYKKSYVTEANPELYFYIENSVNFEKVYTSKDNLSSVYLKTSTTFAPTLSI